MSRSHSGEKNKTIGYLSPKYSRINAYVHHDLGGNIREVPGVAKMIETLKKRAKGMSQPDWYIKGAALYFTYNEECYVILPQHLGTSDEIFERLVDDMTEKLYKIGAYDMFYAGMMD